MAAYPPADRPAVAPAGFWQRAAAWSLDAALLGPFSLLLTWQLAGARAVTFTRGVDQLLTSCGHAMGRAIIDGTPLPALATTLLHDPALQQAVAGMDAVLWSLVWPPLACFAGLSAIYHVTFESGPRQATPGQRLIGLHVADIQRQRLLPGQALRRHLAGAASWLTLNIGHLMAAAPPAHLSLHDRLSRTRVCAANPHLPAWAKTWLALLAIGQLALIGWWMTSAMETMQAALEQSLR